MDAEETEPQALWRAVARSGARALVIGRQAMIILGAPVATFDYAFWIHIDDAERFNAALQPRQQVELEPGVQVALPSLESMIATRQLGARSKDTVDIAFLRTLPADAACGRCLRTLMERRP